jgi:hypothetical protein
MYLEKSGNPVRVVKQQRRTTNDDHKKIVAQSMTLLPVFQSLCSQTLQEKQLFLSVAGDNSIKTYKLALKKLPVKD